MLKNNAPEYRIIRPGGESFDEFDASSIKVEITSITPPCSSDKVFIFTPKGTFPQIYDHQCVDLGYPSKLVNDVGYHFATQCDSSTTQIGNRCIGCSGSDSFDTTAKIDANGLFKTASYTGIASNSWPCVSSCPPGSKIQGKKCVASCPNGYKDDGTNCIECTNGLKSDGSSCVSSCPTGKYEYQNNCVYTCPSFTFIQNHMCVLSCSSTQLETGISFTTPIEITASILSYSFSISSSCPDCSKFNLVGKLNVSSNICTTCKKNDVLNLYLTRFQSSVLQLAWPIQLKVTVTWLVLSAIISLHIKPLLMI